MNKCKLIIDDSEFSFDVEGNFQWGEDKFLYNPEDNILNKTKFIDKGYTIENIFSKNELKDLVVNVKKNILNIALSSGINF